MLVLQKRTNIGEGVDELSLMPKRKLGIEIEEESFEDVSGVVERRKKLLEELVFLVEKRVGEEAMRKLVRIHSGFALKIGMVEIVKLGKGGKRKFFVLHF